MWIVLFWLPLGALIWLGIGNEQPLFFLIAVAYFVMVATWRIVRRVWRWLSGWKHPTLLAIEKSDTLWREMVRVYSLLEPPILLPYAHQKRAGQV